MKNNLFFAAVFFCSMGLMTSCSSGGDPTEPEKPTTPDKPETPENILAINTNQTFQTMDGFGASDCWCGNYVGRDWEESQRAQIADLLFSREIKNGRPVGIGLSMWRTNVGAGSANQGEASGIEDKSRRADCYLQEDGTYDWTQAAGQRYFLDKATEKGCESVVLFSVSPPVWYTINGKAYSNQGKSANLQTNRYKDFATFLAKVTKHYESLGYPVKYISPLNEPQYSWDSNKQEGSGWTNNQIAQVTRDLDTALTEEGSNAKILLAEAGSYPYLYQAKANDPAHSNQIHEFFDASSSNYLGNLEHMPNIIGGHSYWTDANWDELKSVRNKLRDACAAKSLKAYQTEWSMLGSRYNGSHFKGYDNSDDFDIAMYLSQVIHHDLASANISSWCFWTAMDPSRYNHKSRFLLINLKPSSGQYGDISDSGTHEAMKTLWVLGNYSRFIRPNYTRVNITEGLDKNCFGTAYISPDNNTLVAVITNFNNSACTFTPQIEGFEAASGKRYITNRVSNMAESTTDVDSWSVPGYSVTTFVLNK